MPPRERVEHAVERAEHAVERASELMSDKLAEVKPHLRGWLHAGTAPVALVAGIVLVVLSPTASTRVGSAAFAFSALLVFTVSAIYHRGTWSPRTWAFLRRFDHANIFVLIAGTYTPYALLFLDGTARTTLLLVVWLPGLMTLDWMKLKLLLVLGLIVYHVYCIRLVRLFRDDGNTRSHVWYRWFNEVPVVFLIGIVILVIVRPFS